MKVLVLSNMYPSAEKPYAGIFVKNQVEIIRLQHGARVRVDCKAMRRRFTGRIGGIFKYLAFAISCIPTLFRRYDIVHVHYFVPTILIAWCYRFLHRRAKVIVTFHGGDVADHHYAGWRGRLWRRVSRCVDCGIVVGPGVETAVARHLDVKRTVLTPAGIDSRKFYLPPEPVEKQYELVFAGSFIERKGLDLLIEALDRPELAQVPAVFVGTGPMRERLDPLVKRGTAEILDHLTQDEMREVFWKSRFIVLPSRSEPFGLVVSEAMFCGAAAVVSDESGLTMQVDNGRNGLVFRNGSVDGLADALTRATRLSSREYAAMASEAATSNRQFDIVNIVDELIELYDFELSAEGRPTT